MSAFNRTPHQIGLNEVNYLSVCKNYTPKSIRVAKEYLKDKLIELMSDEWIVNVVLN